MTRRQAFTLLELVIALALSVVLFALVYQFWSTAQKYSANLEQRIDRLSRAQMRLLGVSRELQRARRLVYPAPGGPEKPGVGIVTADREVVMYHLLEEKRSDGFAGGRLVRQDAGTGKSETVLEDVIGLWCRVPAVPSGRSADIVHVTLAMRGADGQPLFLVISAHLRALDVPCPVNR